MGQRYELNCNQCGYEQIVNVGYGINAKRPFVIQNSLAGDDLVIWQKKYSENNFETYMAENVIGHCRTCGTIDTVYLVTCKTKDGEDLVLGNRCSHCGNEYELLSNADKIPCPNCNHDIMDSKIIGHWD